MASLPLLAPLYLPGQEPAPPGTTQEERTQMQEMMKYQKMMGYAMESCPVKTVMSGGMGKCHTLNRWHGCMRQLCTV